MFDDLDGKVKKVSREEYREFKHKEHNERQKKMAKTIGENFATFSLVAIVMLMIGSIWSEVGIFSNWKRFLGDALVTVVLYIMADISATYIGTQGGKLDDGYIKNHEEYLSLREKVRNSGITLMSAFCDWQIDIEYEFYLRKRCKKAKIDYKEYMEKYHGKTLEELATMFPLESVKSGKAFDKAKGIFKNAKTSDKAIKIFELSMIQPIELTPDILMTDGMVRNKRGNVGMSGEEYVEKHSIGKTHIAITAIVAIIAAVPTFTLVQEFSVGAIIYTIFKICMLLFRMHSGYSQGAKAFNSVEIAHIQDKVRYLVMYLEFINNKTYLNINDKYDIVNLLGDEGNAEDKRQDEIDEGGVGEHQDRLGDNAATI